jgi:hypothetical protein
VKVAHNLKIFTYTEKNITGHHKLITSIDSNTGSNLVFLLSGHDLSVGSRDLNSCVEACFVHGVGDVTSEGVLWSYGAVVGSLGTVGHTTLGPSERGLSIEVEEGEFLLQSEPDFFIVLTFECLCSCSWVKKRKDQ